MPELEDRGCMYSAPWGLLLLFMPCPGVCFGPHSLILLFCLSSPSSYTNISSYLVTGQERNSAIDLCRDLPVSSQRQEEHPSAWSRLKCACLVQCSFSRKARSLPLALTHHPLSSFTMTPRGRVSGFEASCLGPSLHMSICEHYVFS